MPEAWMRIKELAGEAMERPATERGTFLDAACAGDTKLRSRVEDLLRAYEKAGADGFLEPPSVSVPDAPAPGGAGAPPKVNGDAAGPRTDSAAPSPHRQRGTADALVGARIGNYRIRRLIGSGGMGAVYEAVQEQPRRTVALKVMRSGIASRSALRRFEYESQLLARLRHPGVAQVFEAGTHQDGAGGPVPFFAMEYIPGAKSITEFAAARALPTRDRLALFAKVCDAVHHGHQKGIVHRDLKPGNILVDSSGQPKIIDFGVARATDSDLAVTTLQTDVGQLVGTLQYMSPEQCAADPNDIDTRSDVYSLGVVLYELLTGKLPYDLKSAPVFEAARVIREQAPARPSTVDRLLRGDVETITLKALEKGRERRYGSAAELGADIERYLRSEPIIARPASMLYQLAIFTRRHRVTAFAAAIVALALALGLVGVTVGLLRAKAEVQAANVARRKAHAEAIRSDRIASFLKATIAAANPYRPPPPRPGAAAYIPEEDSSITEASEQSLVFAGERGHDFSISDLFTQAGAKLEEAFADDPRTRAELSDMLGLTLTQLGRFSEAIPLLRQAVQIRGRELGEEAEDTVRSKRRLALAMENLGDTPGAEPVRREVLAARTKTLGAGHPRTLEAAGCLAVNLAALDRINEAVDLQRRTVQTAYEALGADHRATLEATNTLAGLLTNQGQLAEAEVLVLRAIEGLRRVAGPDAPSLASALITLSGIVQSSGGRGQLEQAEGLIREALAINRRSFGENTLRTMFYEPGLASVLVSQHKWEEAIAISRHVLDSTRRAFGADSFQSLRAEFGLARVLGRAGAELPEAERLARHALEGYRKVYPENDPITVMYADALGVTLLRQGRALEAERIFRRLVDLVNKYSDLDRLRMEQFLGLHLGQAMLAQGEGRGGSYAEAEEMLKRAIAAVDAQPRPDPVRRGDIARELVGLYETWGKPDEARRWEEQATPKRPEDERR